MSERRAPLINNSKSYQLDSEQMGLAFKSLSGQTTPLAEMYLTSPFIFQHITDNQEKLLKFKSSSFPRKTKKGHFVDGNKPVSAMNAFIPSTVSVTSLVFNKAEGYNIAEEMKEAGTTGSSLSEKHV